MPIAAPTLTPALPDISLVRNPLPATLHSTDLIITSGTSAYVDIKITGLPAVNDNFTLTFGTTSITFTFKTTPDGTGLQLPATTPSPMSMLAYATAVSDALNASYHLSTTFTARVMAATNHPLSAIIRCEANAIGILSPSITVNTGTTVEEHDDQPGTDKEIQENYKLLADLHVEETYLSGTFQKIIEIMGRPAEATGLTNFKLDTYLRPYMEQRLLDNINTILPPIYPAAPLEQPFALMRYYLRWAAEYGTPAIAQRATTSGIRIAMLAGVAHWKYPGHTTFDDYTGLRILSYGPRALATVRTMPHYHYALFNYTVATDIHHFTIITYTDNTQKLIRHATHSIPAGYHITGIHAGYLQLSLDAHLNGKTIYKWHNYFGTSDGTAITEGITHYLEESCEYDNAFLFINSFGVFEAVRLSGPQEYALSLQGSEGEVMQPVTYTPADRQYIPIHSPDRSVHTVSTGYLPRTTISYLQELIQSRHAFILWNNTWVPINIQRKDIAIDDNRAPLRAFSFQFSPAYNKINHSII